MNAVKLFIEVNTYKEASSSYTPRMSPKDSAYVAQPWKKEINLEKIAISPMFYEEWKLFFLEYVVILLTNLLRLSNVRHMVHILNIDGITYFLTFSDIVKQVREVTLDMVFYQDDRLLLCIYHWTQSKNYVIWLKDNKIKLHGYLKVCTVFGEMERHGKWIGEVQSPSKSG